MRKLISVISILIAFVSTAQVSILPGINGGTGVANTGKTVTLGGSLITTGTATPTFDFRSTNRTYRFRDSSGTLALMQDVNAVAPSVTAPLTISGHTISITQSSGSTDGYLSSADWNTFNGKQNALVAGSNITISSNTISATVPASTFTINTTAMTTGNAYTITAAAGTLTGATLNSGVTTSSLTSVGTLTAGTWNASTIGDSYLTTPYVKADGTRALTADWGVGTFNITGIKSYSISGTAGNGYGEFIAQSSNASAPSSTGFRWFANSAGSPAWAKKNGTDTYVRAFASTNTADRTYTWPDLSGTVATIDGGQTFSSAIWNGTAIGAAYGGTGQGSYAIGDLLYASGSTALSKLAGVATGNALISGGVTTAPSWGKIGLTTHVSGTLGTANGGTNLTAFTANQAFYSSSTSAMAGSANFTFNGTNAFVGAPESTGDFPARLTVRNSSAGTTAGAGTVLKVLGNNTNVGDVAEVGFGTFSGSAYNSAATMGAQVVSNSTYKTMRLTFSTRTDVASNINPTMRWSVEPDGTFTGASNINMTFAGTGGIVGTTTNNNTAAGNVGEYVENSVTSGSAVTFTTATTMNVTSITLTAGDWQIEEAIVNFSTSGASSSDFKVGTNSTSATFGGDNTWANIPLVATGLSDVLSEKAPYKRYSLASTTTIYLVANTTFSLGSVTGYGLISARRVR